jgi:hypothetical protein
MIAGDYTAGAPGAEDPDFNPGARKEAQKVQRERERELQIVFDRNAKQAYSRSA